MLELSSVDFNEFIDGDEEPYDWVIPDLLEHGDRAIITGREGKGKSTLLKQLVVYAACGIHPFTMEEIEPVRCWYIDLENITRHVKREFRKLFPGMQPVNLIVSSWPSGIDLHAETFQTAVTAKLRELKPDLVIVGPKYKMTSASLEHGDEGSKELATIIDIWREAFNIAIVIEDHQPHGSLGQDEKDKKSKFIRPERPVGSSMWMRWPEFGFCLEDGGVLRPWRGKRDADRQWPEKLFPSFETHGIPFMIEPHSCVRCGKPLSGKQERFCSNTCAGATRMANSRAKQRALPS